MSSSKTVKVIGGGGHVGQGYMLREGPGVAAFFVDVWSQQHNRLYPIASGRDLDGFPQLHLVPQEDNGDAAMVSISFPEYPGYNVHCSGGGKTIAVCLSNWDDGMRSVTSPTPSPNYVCPDELDTLIDQAQMSPEQEAWCVMAVMDYRLACQQVKLAIEYNNKRNKAHVE
jgi:hypothetical protein